MRHPLRAVLVLLGGLACLPSPAAADPCLPGFVWREAFPGDQVCVPPASRERAARDNAAAASRKQPDPPGEACRDGFVWREAFAGDTVCVSPDARAATRQANSLSASRTGVAQSGPDGPRLCRAGFVWRAAGPRDFACVTPADRARAAAENAAAPARRGTDACLPGFVWREANPADRVCVPPRTRDDTAEENARAPSRVVSVGLAQRCDLYARTAVAQNEERIRRGCGFSGDRWQSNHAAHYGWCLGAQELDRGGEEGARAFQLRHQCGGTAQASPTLGLTLLPPEGFTTSWRLLLAGTGFPAGGAVTVTRTSQPLNEAVRPEPDQTLTADALGRIEDTRAVPCEPGRPVRYTAVARTASGARSNEAGGRC